MKTSIWLGKLKSVERLWVSQLSLGEFGNNIQEPAFQILITFYIISYYIESYVKKFVSISYDRRDKNLD